MVEVMTRWERRGWERGRAEGREEGVHQALTTVVLDQLTEQYGPLDEAIVVQVRALSRPHLRALAKALLHFGDQADLAAWLAAPTA